MRSKEELDKIKNAIIEEYKNGAGINPLTKKYNVAYNFVQRLLKKNNIPDNYTGRFQQQYIIHDDYAEIGLKTKDGIIYTKIDLDDVDKCRKFGIWTLGGNGYVINCKTGTYLHHFVMNRPKGLEVDHIYHDTLDNRKSQLRIATSSQQKMNTKIRSDNTSGHRGVYYDKSRNTWNINIRVQGRYYRKRYKTYQEACNQADIIYENEFGEYRYNVQN